MFDEDDYVSPDTRKIELLEELFEQAREANKTLASIKTAAWIVAFVVSLWALKGCS